MHLVMFNNFRLGVLVPQGVIDVHDAASGLNPGPRERLMCEVIEHFGELSPRIEALAAEGKVLPLASVRLRPPIPQPSKILCAFANYRDRPQLQGDVEVEAEFFLKAFTAIIGPEDTIHLPDLPVLVYQHEAELAFVMGKRARHVPQAQAMDYVFGYVPFIDVSARGLRRRTHFMTKAQDTWAPIGPALVTKDEVPDPHNLRVRLWNNGVLKTDYSSAAMANRIPRLIEFASSCVTLLPGDILATGTHHEGLGPLVNGDRVELEIQGLGRMTVRVHGEGPPKTADWHPGDPN